VLVSSSSHPHDELPEEQIFSRRHNLADNGLAQNLKKRKWLEVGKDEWCEERESSYTVRIAMRALDGDGASRVMAHHVPALDAALDAQRFDGCGQGVHFAEIPEAGAARGRGQADQQRCRSSGRIIGR
jgi:hypothetical protein